MPSILIKPKFILPRYHNDEDEITLYELNNIIVDDELKKKLFNDLLTNLEERLKILIKYEYETNNYDYSGYINIERINNLEDELDILFKITRFNYNEQDFQWYIIEDFNNNSFSILPPNKELYGNHKSGIEECSCIILEIIPNSYTVT